MNLITLLGLDPVTDQGFLLHFVKLNLSQPSSSFHHIRHSMSCRLFRSRSSLMKHTFVLQFLNRATVFIQPWFSQVFARLPPSEHLREVRLPSGSLQQRVAIATFPKAHVSLQAQSVVSQHASTFHKVLAASRRVPWMKYP